MIGKLIKSLWIEFPAFRLASAAVLLIGVIAAYAATRPAPPDKVLDRYVERLNRRDCNAAFQLLSDNRKERDPDMDTVESYTRSFCSNITAQFVKLFVAPQEISTDIAGDSADISYYLCVLPVGFTRRICAKQSASLIREDGHWKINRFDVGNWSGPRNARNEKNETLIPDYSPEKRN